jgi:predicted transposase/invertase (TIGR01784 family)
LFDKDEDKQALSLILNWFEQLAVHGKIERIDFEHLRRVYSSKQEVDMIVDSVRKYKQTAFEEGLQQGVQLGMQQGLQQGTVQAKLDIATTMLRENLELSLIAKLTGLSEAEILQLQNSTH